MPDLPQPRRPRWLLGFMGLLALLGILFLLFNRLVESELKPLITKALSQAAQGPVTLTSVVGSLAGNVVLNGLSLDLPGYPWRVHLDADQVAVKLNLINLILRRKALQNCVQSLLVTRPQVSLIRNDRNENSGITVNGPGSGSLSSASLTATTPLLISPFKLPVFLVPAPRLFVREGTFKVKAGKDTQTLLAGVDFEASSNDGNDWSLALSSRPPNRNEGGLLRFNGSLHLDSLKIWGKMNLADWPLAQAGLILQDLAGWQLTGGTLDADCPMVYQPDRGLWFAPMVELHEASILSPKPLCASFEKINGKVQVKPSQIEILGDLRFDTGGTPWKAHGTIPMDGRPLQVQASTEDLHLSSLSTGLLKLKGTSWEGQGKASLEIAGTFQEPLLTAEATLGASHLGMISIEGFQAQARYEKGLLYLSGLQGHLYKGTFTAQGQIGLTGQADAPLSITADLKDLDLGNLFLSLGWKEFPGKTQAQIELSGTLQNPVISAMNHADFDATDSHDAYSMQNLFQWKEGVISLDSKINGQDQMKSRVLETTDGWKIQQLDLAFSKRGGKISGSGYIPKDPNQPIALDFKTPPGEEINLETLPFFHERFQDVKGRVQLEARASGTGKSPEIVVNLNGPSVTLVKLSSLSGVSTNRNKANESFPLSVELAYNRSDVVIRDLEYGQIFSAKGRYGINDDSLDLTFNANGFPLPTLVELSGWSNPPQPIEGILTGKLHLAGVRNNPVLDGDALITQFKLGEWWADQAEASLNRDQGKIIIRKLRLTQGNNDLIASGGWDMNAQPGQMNLRFFLKDFQMGKGPYLTGNFLWTAQTGTPWFKNWTGRFSSDSFRLDDGKNKGYAFTHFLIDATFQDMNLEGKFQLGDSVEGRGTFDFSHGPPLLKGSLTISPTLISHLPEVGQFIPPGLKVDGVLSGKIHFGSGPWDRLPLDGNLQIADGVIAKKYSFENLGLRFSGNLIHLEPSLKLEQKNSDYELSGTLDSPNGFWSPGAKVDLKGPFNDSLARLLRLADLDPIKHQADGSLKGQLVVGGTWSKLDFDFSMSGDNLRFDDNQVLSSQLHCGYSEGRLFLDKTRLTLNKGEINIERGSLSFDPSDPSHLSLAITGSTKDLSISLFHLTNRINLDGDLYLDEKTEKPTFAGKLSFLDSSSTIPPAAPFVLSLSVKHKILELLPSEDSKPQLVGVLDLSEKDKILFQQIRLLNAPGSFNVDGTLDLAGESHLSSDAKDIPIQQVAKWVMKDFPMSGLGNYHVVFDGPLAHPILTASLTVNNGRVGQLPFDLFTAQLRTKNDTLFLGDEEAPMEISRSGLYDFTAYGKVPLALTASTREELKDREMDLTARMDKGDFSLLLAAGLAKAASGSVSFEAHVTGTLDNPVVSSLDLDLAQCRMVPSMIAQSLEDINGRVKIRDNKLAVEDLNFRVGQGKIFITSPPIEKSRMVLDNFIPQYLDFRIRTVGDHGLWLNVPTIMKKNEEWGEVFFYGQTPEDPLLVTGPLSEPHVIGTALLETGHYTFPPIPTLDENGQPIEYRELSNVYFQLNLVSGNNCWYQNDSNTNFLELKVDPGETISIEGKDSDSVPGDAGIKAQGSPTSSKGYLRYLSHEFKLQDARLNIPRGKLPYMQGHATDKFLNVELVTPGGSIQHTDMDVFLTFQGTFGNIDFTLDSNPRFSTNDKEIQQKVLLSYIMFGRDMTGYSGQAYNSQQLQQIYQQQNVGQVVPSAFIDAINRVGTSQISSYIRPFFSSNFGIDAQVTGNPLGGGSGPSAAPTPGVTSPEATGNTLAGTTQSMVNLQMIKPIDSHLSVETNFGLGRDIYTNTAEVQARLGLDYSISNKLLLSGSVGQNDVNQNDERLEMRFKTELPDIISPKQGDKEKPRFEHAEYYPIRKGKYHLTWTLDKVTQSVARIFDSTGKVVQILPDKAGYAYKHELDVEGLSDSQDYKILLSAKDPNGNEATSTLKIPALSD